MFLYILLLVIGMILLVKGADFFVDGASRLAKALKIPSLIIGLTLVSIGTSAPEISVNVNSAIKGFNDMQMGNVVGSNIFNTLLILGVSSLIIPLSIDREVKRFNLPILVIICFIFALFCFVITPYQLDIFESIFLLFLTIDYLIFLVARSKRITNKFDFKKKQLQLEQEEQLINKKQKPLWLSLILAVFGLAGVIFGGTLVVNNASNLAKALGMSESLVALTIVSVGTSLPELVTSVVASVKKENDMAIGNIIGSNIFNIILILGLSSTISPLVISTTAVFDIAVMILSTLIIFIISLFSKKITRWQGAMLVIMYIAYLTYIIIRN